MKRNIICVIAALTVSSAVAQELNDLAEEQSIIDAALPIGTSARKADTYLTKLGYQSMLIEYYDQPNCWTKDFPTDEAFMIRDICYASDKQNRLTEIEVYQYEAYP